MAHAIFFAFLLIASGIFAGLEIQAEGKNGWAADFPTWRIKNKWTKFFLGGKPLTGYHLFFMLFMIFIVHIPYALGIIPLTWASELRIIAFLVLFFVIEDFLWFVFNPSYGMKKFKPEYIWWHAVNWWGPVPRDYWLFVPIGIAVYVLSYVV